MSVAATTIPADDLCLCDGCGLRARYAVGEATWCSDCAIKSIKALAGLVILSEPARKKDLDAFFGVAKRKR